MTSSASASHTQSARVTTRTRQRVKAGPQRRARCKPHSGHSQPRDKRSACVRVQAAPGWATPPARLRRRGWRAAPARRSAAHAPLAPSRRCEPTAAQGTPQAPTAVHARASDPRDPDWTAARFAFVRYRCVRVAGGLYLVQPRSPRPVRGPAGASRPRASSMRCSSAQAVRAPACAPAAASRRAFAAAAAPARRCAPAGAQPSRLSARLAVAGGTAGALRVAPAAGSRSRLAAMAVQAASAPDYSSEEYKMEWSPTLVPSGPWKVIEGCGPLALSRHMRLGGVLATRLDPQHASKHPRRVLHVWLVSKARVLTPCAAFRFTQGRDRTEGLQGRRRQGGPAPRGHQGRLRAGSGRRRRGARALRLRCSPLAAQHAAQAITVAAVCPLRRDLRLKSQL